MSIEVMSQVMLRYPAGGGERLVALALADNASSDGQRIFPTVDGIAHRAFLSTRSVQRHLRSMVASGWLILVRANSGRQGDTNHYRISPEWLAGGECVPPKAAVRRQPARKPKEQTGVILSPVESVDNSPQGGDGRVTPEVLTGDTGVTQTINNRQNTNTPLTPLPALVCGQLGPESGHPDNRTSGLAEKAGGRPLPSWVFRSKRWKGTRERVEQVGELLGIGRWDRKAYEAAQLRAPHACSDLTFSAYEGRVLQLVERAKGSGVRHG
jgi:hypothetical protein